MALDVSLFLLGLDVNAAPSGGGGGSYSAKAVAMAEPLTVQNVSLTAGSSSKFTVAYWLKLSDPNSFQYRNSVWFAQVFPGSTTENIYTNFQPNVGATAGKLQTHIQGGGKTVQIDSAVDVMVPDTWYLILISCDLNHADGAKQLQQYIGDVDQAITVTDGQSAFAVNFSGMQVGMADFAFVAASFQTPGLEVSDFQLWVGQAPDLSVTANRRLFIDGTGKPVNPTVAAAALGSPTVLLSGDATGYAVNQGSGGSGFGVFDSFIVPGSNGAGSVSVPGALVGASVLTVVNDGDFSVIPSDFEAVISIADHIQQTSANDYSAVNLDIALHQGALTNASTHP